MSIYNNFRYKIAITGKANSGKNTLMSLLEKEFRSKIIITNNLAFADPVKEIIRTMFPHLTDELLYGPSENRNYQIPNAFKDNKPLTIRQACFDIGSELGRSYNTNIWLENLDLRAKKILDENIKNYNTCLFVTDCRFRNEFEHLQANGFTLIKIKRDLEAKLTHISDTEQDTIKDNEFDFIIHNNSTLEFLKEQARNVIKDIEI